ncbi:hypothetical protein M0P98_07925 [bacterium]|nr:hypothetical protein [bacterium]
MPKTIMFIGAHSGDIEMFAGGTLAKCFDRGYRIIYIITTNNMSATGLICPFSDTLKVDKSTPVEMMQLNKLKVVSVASKVDTYPVFLGHPQRNYIDQNGGMEEIRYGCKIPQGVGEDVPTILTAHENQGARNELKDIILNKEPYWVITHGVNNEQIEHLATALLVAKSCQDAVAEGFKGGLLLWNEGNSEIGTTNNLWDVSVNISEWIDRKKEFVEIGASPKAFHYIRDVNKDWGNKCGYEYAEVFIVAERGSYETLS